LTEEIATTAEGNVPALAYNPAQELTAEDISTPRVKIAQGLSQVVADGTVPLFAIYSSVGQDDQSPNVLVKPLDSAGLRFYVIDLRKGFSYKDTRDELQSSRDGSYPDLSLVLDGEPKNVSRTFDYTIVVPDHDTFLPYKLLLTRTGQQAAKAINHQLLLASMQEVDSGHVPFVVKVLKRQNDKGTFGVPSVSVADVPAVQLKKDIELVDKLRSRVAPSHPTPTPSAPAIEAPALD
jgi:hypothetical protein